MMKFRVDQPVSPIPADWLRQSGHDAYHLRERGLSRAGDAGVFAAAVTEARIIITADLDFSRILAISGRQGPGLILFRAGNISDEQMLALLKAVMNRVPPEQLMRSVAVADSYALRIAPLPLRPDLRD